MKYILTEEKLENLIKYYIDKLVGNLKEVSAKEMGLPYESSKVFFVNNEGKKIFIYLGGKLYIDEDLVNSLRGMFNYKSDDSVSVLKLGYLLIDYFKEKFPLYSDVNRWNLWT